MYFSLSYFCTLFILLIMYQLLIEDYKNEILKLILIYIYIYIYISNKNYNKNNN